MTDLEPELELVATLREQAGELVEQTPGPLRKVTVSAGDAAVTVEWAEPTGPASPDGAVPTAAPPQEPEQPAGTPVTAPLVGTFYRAPEPGADPFVQVGDAVTADQTVAIVEAMKLMNPVKAPRAGTVAAIHVEDGEMVEFGQPLLDLAAAPDDG